MLKYFFPVSPPERRVVKAIALNVFRAYRAAIRDGGNLPQTLRGAVKDIGEAWRESGGR